MYNIDNELLKLAALAAGYEIEWKPNELDDGYFILREHIPFGEEVMWNPLVFDGDAFRLAVLLRFHMSMSTPEESSQWAYAGRRNETPWASEVTSTPCAAMRRAIVCAAAEIGLLRKCGEPHEQSLRNLQTVRTTRGWTVIAEASKAVRSWRSVRKTC